MERPLLPLLALLALLPSRAFTQVINGAFEDAAHNASLTGWNATCGSLMPMMDDPNGDVWSVAVPVDTDIPCSGPSPFSIGYQAVPAVGDVQTWTLSGWIRMSPDNGGAAISVMDQNFIGSAGNLFVNANNATQWTYLEVTGTTNTNCPCVVALNAGPGAMGSYTLFDDIQLLGQSTGIASSQRSAPAFRPDPASDRLWVDLQDRPLSAQGRDVLGRIFSVPVISFHDRTVELDVTAVAQGLCFLEIATAKGLVGLRFVKI